jgi:hypothetical protein
MTITIKELGGLNKTTYFGTKAMIAKNNIKSNSTITAELEH